MQTLLEGSNASTGEDVSAPGGSNVSSLTSGSAKDEAAMAPSSSEQNSTNGIPRQFERWPILREGEGGAEVSNISLIISPPF